MTPFDGSQRMLPRENTILHIHRACKHNTRRILCHTGSFQLACYQRQPEQSRCRLCVVRTDDKISYGLPELPLPKRCPEPISLR